MRSPSRHAPGPRHPPRPHNTKCYVKLIGKYFLTHEQRTDTRHTLLSHKDTHLTDNIDITSMPTEQKWEWVRHFNTAKELYDKEKQRTKQKTIFEFMTVKPKPTKTGPKKYTALPTYIS